MRKVFFRTGSRNLRNLYFVNPADPDGPGISIGYAITPGVADLIVSGLNTRARMVGFPCLDCGDSYEEPCTIHPFSPDWPPK